MRSRAVTAAHEDRILDALKARPKDGLSGAELAEATGLWSEPLYVALARMEHDSRIRSEWVNDPCPGRRDGYVCPLATHAKAGRAAAPSARYRNWRRGNFIAFPKVVPLGQSRKAPLWPLGRREAPPTLRGFEVWLGRIRRLFLRVPRSH